MWDVLVWFAVFLAGGVVTVAVGAGFIWAIFHMQNGERDD